MDDLNAEGAKSAQKTLLLIDGANFIYRSHHAMLSMGRDFSAPDGTPTGALMTFANMLEKVRKLFNPDAIAITFESPTGTFRDKLFEGYKAQRPKTPDAVRIQMRLAKQLFPLMGVPAIWAEGFEADDLLCAYGASASAAGWRVVLATSDKDINQVVSDTVGVWDPNIHKDETVHTPESVSQKFGVPPELITQYLALMGDSVDNIPGVEGVGTKTAAKLLLKYKSIDGIMENLADLSPKIRASFEASREILPMALQLSTARLDAPMSMGLEEICAFNAAPKWAEAMPHLERLAMSSLINKARRGMGLPMLNKEDLSAMFAKAKELALAESGAAGAPPAPAPAPDPGSEPTAEELEQWAQAVKAELDERSGEAAKSPSVSPQPPVAAPAPAAGATGASPAQASLFSEEPVELGSQKKPGF